MAEGGPPPPKKRKIDTIDPCINKPLSDRQLLNMRSIIASMEPERLQEYLVTKFDDALHSPKPTLLNSTQSPTPPLLDNNRLGLSLSPTPEAPMVSQGPTGVISGSILRSGDPTTVDALSVIFANLVETSGRAPSATTLNHHPYSMPASTPHSNMHSTQPPNQQEEEELHCARCHDDYVESKNHYGVCIVEHNQENCVRISTNGQSSIWKYGCCGYRFASPYPDVPVDPNATEDIAMYCFVGAHTTDEEEAASTEMNTYTCEEAGCWEDESGGSH